MPNVSIRFGTVPCETSVKQLQALVENADGRFEQVESSTFHALGVGKPFLGNLNRCKAKAGWSCEVTKLPYDFEAGDDVSVLSTTSVAHPYTPTVVESVEYTHNEFDAVLRAADEPPVELELVELLDEPDDADDTPKKSKTNTKKNAVPQEYDITNILSKSLRLNGTGIAQLRTIRLAHNHKNPRRLPLCSLQTIKQLYQCEDPICKYYLDRIRIAHVIDGDTHEVVVLEYELFPESTFFKIDGVDVNLGRTVTTMAQRNRKCAIDMDTISAGDLKKHKDLKHINMSSVGSMKKELRNTFFALQNFHDFDMVNCHPSILHAVLAYADNVQIDMGPLINYLEDRDTCLSAVMNWYECTRDQAKTLFVACMYGGGPHRMGKWAEMHNKVEFMESLEQEDRLWEPGLRRFKRFVDTVANAFRAANEDVYKQYALKKELKGKTPTDAGFMSIILQTIESVINSTLAMRLESIKIREISPMSDGLACAAPESTVLRIATETISMLFKGVHGVKIAYINKPFATTPMVPIEEVKFLSVGPDGRDFASGLLLPMHYRFRATEENEVFERKYLHNGVEITRMYEYIGHQYRQFIMEQGAKIYFNTLTIPDHTIYDTDEYRELFHRLNETYRYVRSMKQYLYVTEMVIEGPMVNGAKMPDSTTIEYTWIDPGSVFLRIMDRASIRMLHEVRIEKPKEEKGKGKEKEEEEGEIVVLEQHVVNVARHWLSDLLRPEFSMVVNVPHDIVTDFVGSKAPMSQVINTWRDPRFAQEHAVWTYTESDEAGVQFLMSFISDLLGPMEGYFWDKLACMIQRPGIRDIHLTILLGQERIGKNAALDIVRYLIGDEFFYATSEIEKIFGRFNSQLRGKLAVVLDEADWRDIPMSQLKSFLTEIRMQVEAKGKDIVEDCRVARLFTSSNDLNVPKRGGDASRPVPILCDPKHKNDTVYFARVYAAIHDTNVMRCLYHKLMQRDWSRNYDPKRIVRTNAISDEFSRPAELQFILSDAFQDAVIKAASDEATKRAVPIQEVTSFQFIHSKFTFPTWAQWATYDPNNPVASTISERESKLPRNVLGQKITTLMLYHSLCEQCGTTSGNARYEFHLMAYMKLIEREGCFYEIAEGNIVKRIDYDTISEQTLMFHQEKPII